VGNPWEFGTTTNITRTSGPLTEKIRTATDFHRGTVNHRVQESNTWDFKSTVSNRFSHNIGQTLAVEMFYGFFFTAGSMKNNRNLQFVKLEDGRPVTAWCTTCNRSFRAEASNGERSDDLILQVRAKFEEHACN